MKQSLAGAAGSNGQQISPLQALMPPPAPRPKKQIVLQEEVWAEGVEKIIERDFFPDLQKLRNKKDWLEAVASGAPGDPEKIREAQLRIQERQLASTPHSASSASTPSIGIMSDSNASTPVIHGGFGSGPTPRRGHGGVSLEAAFARQQEGAGVSGAPNMRLDEFAAKYTSEDNASFLELVEKDNERKANRALNQYAEASQQGLLAQRQLLMLEGPRAQGAQTDGYGTSNQPYSTLIVAPQQAKNQLYFFKDGVPLSAAERSEMVKGPDKEINTRGTRFIAPPAEAAPGTGGKGQGMAAARAEIGGAPPSLQEVMRTPGAAAAQGGVTRGYGFIATPSPAPGVDESPFITWGRMDATPLRLDPTETPMDIGGGGAGGFSMKPERARDKLAHKLGKQAGHSLRQRAGSTIGRSTLGVSPSPIAKRVPGTPGSAGLAAAARTPLSDAARKLLAAKAAQAGEMDPALRASYGRTPKGTPLRTPAGTPQRTPQRTPAATPLRGTAATPARAAQDAAGGVGSGAQASADREAALRAAALSSRQKVAGASAADGGHKTATVTPAANSLTDNLLDL